MHMVDPLATVPYARQRKHEQAAPRTAFQKHGQEPLRSPMLPPSDLDSSADVELDVILGSIRRGSGRQWCRRLAGSWSWRLENS